MNVNMLRMSAGVCVCLCVFAFECSQAIAVNNVNDIRHFNNLKSGRNNFKCFSAERISSECLIKFKFVRCNSPIWTLIWNRCLQFSVSQSTVYSTVCLSV